MNTDYSYCSGVTCSIRKSCKRYLPDPPDTRLQWVWPAYNPNSQMGTALTAMAVNGMLPTPAARDYQPSVSPQALKRQYRPIWWKSHHLGYKQGIELGSFSTVLRMMLS